MSGKAKPRQAKHPNSTPPGCRWIPLTRGLFALVDSDDYELVSQFSWSSTPGRKTSYAVGWVNGRVVKMHRLILGFPDEHVDHRDGNGLNNTRHNLRKATVSQNHANTPPPKTNTTGLKGVGYDKSRDCWYAQITVRNRHIHLGRFDTSQDAARAYREAAKKHFGEFAMTGETPS